MVCPSATQKDLNDLNPKGYWTTIVKNEWTLEWASEGLLCSQNFPCDKN